MCVWGFLGGLFGVFFFFWGGGLGVGICFVSKTSKTAGILN